MRIGSPGRIDAETAERIRGDLRDFARLGGFTLRPRSTPWYGAALRTAEQARQAADLASRLHSHLLPLLAYRVDQACGEVGLRTPGGYLERAARLRLFEGVAETMRRLSPRVFEAAPTRLAEATSEPALLRAFRQNRPGGQRVSRAEGSGGRRAAWGDWFGRWQASWENRFGGWRRAAREGAPLGLWERRALRKQARAFWLGANRPERADLRGALAEAAAQLAEWESLRVSPPDGGSWRPGPAPTGPLPAGGRPMAGRSGSQGVRGRPPWPPSELGDLLRLEAGCEARLDSLRAYVRVPDDPEQVLAALCADRDTAWRLPSLYELGMRLDSLGLGALLDDLVRKEADADLAVAAFDHAWYSAILDHLGTGRSA
ncbi:hypothetical protein ITP53_53740 [Nonomuraea sp. K274]|uniref:Uncharacterized protein n=1 Tax=Nonomuraea cypriaca TaxID=1187855 RepID=A0A931AQ42_9ACTN|nr:hypothetical protein [Nonomuraea cypriaca]